MPVVIPYAPTQIYQPNGRLADLIRQSGQDAAAAAERRGQISAQLWGNIGNTIQNTVGNVIQQQQNAPKIALEKAAADKAQQDRSDTAAIDTASQPAGALKPGETGPVDNTPPTHEQILAALPGHLRPVVQRQFDEDAVRTASVAKAQEDLASANASKLSGLRLAIVQHDYDPAAVNLAITSALSTYKNDPAMSAQIQRVASMLQNNPSKDAIQQVVNSIPLTKTDQETLDKQVQTTRKGMSDAALATLDHLKGDGSTPLSARDVLTSRLASGISDGTIAPGPGNQALKTAASIGPDQLPQVLSQFVTPEDKAAWELKNSETAKNLAEADKAKNPPKDTAIAADNQYRDIQTRMGQNQPVSDLEKSWASAYEKQKTLGPETTAAAANYRQLKTLSQQLELQNRQQAFTEAQAGRSELTSKIEQPYLDAVEKADTLRSVVNAAKNGNLEAAAVQSLLGTLGLVTTEGVKRINSTELQQVAGAGSLFDSIKNRIGKLKDGQPLDPKLQSDLSDLSGLLEKSARKKYEAGFNATTKRYNLSDETAIPDRNASVKMKAPNGQISTVSADQVDHFKSLGATVVP